MLDDVDTGRGNIDHIVVGPDGVFSVETKSRRGKIAAARVDGRMLAQAEHVESLIGHAVSPLLVFSRAFLAGRPVSLQRGVRVLPARMLAGHLARWPARLSSAQVDELHHRLLRALDPAWRGSGAASAPC